MAKEDSANCVPLFFVEMTDMYASHIIKMHKQSASCTKREQFIMLEMWNAWLARMELKNGNVRNWV
jgi:hypothetical protein